MKKVLVIGVVTILLLLLVPSVSATWCDNDHGKRAPILINNTGGSAQTYYQVELNYTYDSDMNANFSDIRVYNESGCSLVSLWNESAVASSWNDIWINFSDIPASSWANDTYYLYYNYSSASSVSNITTTFIFGDDFGGETDYNTDWYIGTGASIPEPKTDFAAGITGDKIYVAIGEQEEAPSEDRRNTTFEYNITTDTWTNKTDSIYALDDIHGDICDGKLYAVGGEGAGSVATNHLQIYNITNNSWSSGTNLPWVNEESAVACVNSKIYSLGGYDGSQKRDDNIVYNISDNTWYTNTDIPYPRDNGGEQICVYNDEIYFSGGQDVKTARLGHDDLYKYNVTTNTYTQLADVPELVEAGALVVYGDYLFQLGAYTYNDGGNYRSTFRYNISANTWERGKSLLIDNNDKSCFFAAVYGDTLYIIGGTEHPGGVNDVVATVEKYNLSQWEPQEEESSWENQWTTGAGTPVYQSETQARSLPYSAQFSNAGWEYAHANVTHGDIAIEKWMYIDSVTTAAEYAFHSDGTNNIYLRIPNDRIVEYRDSGGTFHDTAITAPLDTWFKFKIYNIDWTAKTYDIEVDGTVESIPDMHGVAANTDQIRIGVYVATTYYDDVFVRKYTSPEPTASLGTEESPSADTYIPPDPTNLQNTTGNFWVNYTWDAGDGNVTNSYNVSNETAWNNGSSNTYLNESLEASEWLNITVYAWNSSGGGTLSAGSVSDQQQAPSVSTKKFYETSTSDFSAEVAVIDLYTSRDDTQNNVAYELATGNLYNYINATSNITVGNDIKIPAGTKVNFSAYFDDGDRVNYAYATWKFYRLVGTSTTLVCQKGDDSTGGVQIPDGTTETITGYCSVTSDVTLNSTDKVRLIMNVWAETIGGGGAATKVATHYWDSTHESWVEYKYQTTTTDTTFTVSLPVGYTKPVFQPPNSTATNYPPNGQTDSQEFFNVTNSGNVNLDVRMRLNTTVSTITLKADADNNPTGADTIGTSLVTIHSNLGQGSSADIWLWSDFDHTPAQTANRTIYINVSQS